MGWKDILLNIIIYIPVGLLAALKLHRRPLAARILLPLLLGSGLSLSVEVMQVYDVSRYPSGLDWTTNTVGTALGIALAVLVPQWFTRPLAWTGARVRRSPAAATLCAAWLLFWGFPWVPYLSPYGWGQKFTILLRAPWPFLALLGTAVAYLAFGALLDEISRHRAVVALGLAVFIVPGQVAILGRQPSWIEWVGALTGFAAFLGIRKHRSAARIAAIAVVFAIVVQGLEPFRLSISPTPFEWVPLVATMSYDRPAAILKLLEKCAWYGTAVWLLHRAGTGLWTAAFAVAILLAGLETMQMWLPGRTPESTDPLIAIAMTALFVSIARSAANRRPEYVASSGRQRR